MTWKKVIDTADLAANGYPESTEDEEGYVKKIEIGPRTIAVLVAKQEEKHAPVASL